MYWRGRMAEDDREYGTGARVLSEALRALSQLLLRGAGPPPAGDAAGGAGGRRGVVAACPSSRALDPVSQITDPPEDDLHYNRAKLLENAGMTDLAVRELQAGSTTGPSWEMVEIARIYTSGGEYYRALQELKKAISGYFAMDVSALPLQYWQGLFPRPYWDALRSYSEENGLDPYLVASLIRQESEFNPSAISHANAYGLMQLLPRTGKGEAKKTGLHSLQHRLAAGSHDQHRTGHTLFPADGRSSSVARWSMRSPPTTPAQTALPIGVRRATIATWKSSSSRFPSPKPANTCRPSCATPRSTRRCTARRKKQLATRAQAPDDPGIRTDAQHDCDESGRVVPVLGTRTGGMAVKLTMSYLYGKM